MQIENIRNLAELVIILLTTINMAVEILIKVYQFYKKNILQMAV